MKTDNSSRDDKKTNPSNKSNYKSNKGTGMSSEAGASQNEESWQGTGGSRPKGNSDASNRNADNTSDKGLSGERSGSGNLNTDNIKNQSDQQRRASMGDGTPEKNEKDLKNTNLANEELNDVDWNTDKSKK